MPSCVGQTQSSESDLGQSVRFYRNLFTGELEAVPSDGGGRQIIFRGSAPKHYDPTPVGTPNYDRVCRPLSLKPEDATPARIEAENEAARHHNTGCWYDAKGQCHTVTRGSQNREMKRKNMANFSGGYGDYCGR